MFEIPGFSDFKMTGTVSVIERLPVKPGSIHLLNKWSKKILSLPQVRFSRIYHLEQAKPSSGFENSGKLVQDKFLELFRHNTT